jgi:hypothetical protein
MRLPPVITIILQLAALYAAFMLGKQVERPEKAGTYKTTGWPTGGIMQGGWKAWQLYEYIIVGVSVGLVLMESLSGMGIGGRGRGRGGNVIVGGGRGEYDY